MHVLQNAAIIFTQKNGIQQTVNEREREKHLKKIFADVLVSCVHVSGRIWVTSCN